jgi:hypothetical protein
VLRGDIPSLPWNFVFPEKAPENCSSILLYADKNPFLGGKKFTKTGC